MDVQAANLLAILRRPSAPPEQKLTLLSNIKSDIKHYRVPEQAQGAIFECLKLAISQQNSINIVTAALSTLGHLVKRLKIQDPDGRAISLHAPRLFQTLQDRLGDSRDSHRTAALQAFIDLHPFCAAEVEQLIREDALAGTNSRLKEMAMQWVVRMHEDHGLAFKSFVPAMVACLEDADGVTRDAAKASLVDLFRTASTPAKNDLKKNLKLHGVRQSIQTQILSQLGVSDRPERPVEDPLAASTRSLPAFDHISNFSESISGEEAKPPPQEEVQMDPIFVHSRSELEDTLRDMMPHFEGRESEENWILRDRDITKLRKITKGNAPSEYHAAYMTGLKQLQEGILKVANSLRTTVMTNGCSLVQELARTLGPAMEPLVENYVSNFIKMCAATKSLSMQSGNQTVDTILQYVSYNIRLMQHVWQAAQDKNKQPRVYAAGWLRTILSRQVGSKTHFEHTGGLEITEKTIKKCLLDADPKVKESMRATYWAFAKSWPDRAEIMMNSFDDSKVKIALERDPHNPNAVNNFAASTSSRTSGARSALRDRIAAAKKAAHTQPPRPMTAMASMSPAKRPTPISGTRPKPMGPPPRVASNTSAMSTDSVSANTPGSRPTSLLSAAARRPVKRPEPPRPATADPYAARKGRPETPSRTPNRTPAHDTVSRLHAGESTIARNRVGRVGSPAGSPLRSVDKSKSGLGLRPVSRDTSDPDDTPKSNGDDFTMVLPSVVHRETASSAAKRRAEIESPASLESAMHGLGIEDNFTFVMPASFSSKLAHGKPSAADRTPPRAMSEDVSSLPRARGARASLNLGSSPANAKSPVNGRAASPRAATPDRRDSPQPASASRPPPRQGSPLKAFSTSAEQPDEVKIYEDPFSLSTNGEKNASAAPEPIAVLTELPVNNHTPPDALDENTINGVLSAPTAPASPPASPTSKAEKLRSRKLLQSGIQRIRARTLDTHGYRKVLELTRTVDANDLFGPSDAPSPPRLYDELLTALCDFVSAAPGTTPIPERPSPRTSGAEVKRQAFTLLRSLLRTTTPPLAAWNASAAYPVAALTATLHGRPHLDPGLPAKDAEALAAEIVPLAPAAPVQNALWAVIARDPEPKAAALALRTLASSLRMAGGAREPDRQSLAPLLTALDAETRKAAVEVAVELCAGKEPGRFWEGVDVPESTKNLVAYFVARREREG